MIAADFGTGQVFLSMLYFFLFILWIWLVIRVLADIFWNAELPGWAKAVWSFLVIVVPLFGVLAYLIARGAEMSVERSDDAVTQTQMQMQMQMPIRIR
jgi:hypothetical protein